MSEVQEKGFCSPVLSSCLQSSVQVASEGLSVVTMPRTHGNAAASNSRPRSSRGARPAKLQRRDDESISAFLDRSEGQTPSTPAAKRPRARSLEQVVAKLLVDNFPTFTSEELYMRTSDETGFTFHQRLMKDKERQLRGEKINMGKLYYQARRDEYKSDAATSQLKVLHMNEPEDDVLVEALLNLFASAKKTIDPFVLWSETTTAVNQKNFVATLRQVMKLPPQKSLENTMVTVGAMKRIVRLRLNTTYLNEVLVMKDQFDAACVKSLVAFKQQATIG